MSKYRQEFGAWGESQAAGYLVDQGYIILDRNVRTRYGEIDLVGLAPDSFVEWTQGGQSVPGKIVVFVEVKTRRSNTYGFPEEAITQRKKAPLLAAAGSFFQAHPELPGTWRIDVISIQQFNENQQPSIMHFENAFS